MARRSRPNRPRLYGFIWISIRSVSFKMKINIYLFILSSLLIVACNNSPKQYAIFNYEDFGPQAMAWEEIGMQWWQWDSQGISSDPNYTYDIKVVVYRDMPLSHIKSLYPVDKAKKKDFRYFEYHDVIKYLDEKIKELNTDKEEWAINLRQHLIETKDRIQQEIKTEN